MLWLPVDHDHEWAHGSVIAVSDYQVAEFILAQLWNDERGFLILSSKFQIAVQFVLSDIGGKFQGELTASKDLIILASGRCTGKVEYQDLVVENGGILNAEVLCKTSSKLPAGKELETLNSSSKSKKGKQIEL